MGTKHTPGPWRAGSGSGGKGSVVSDQLAAGALGGSDAVDYYGGNLIAESVAPENIPLIGAAPELLQALQGEHGAIDWLMARLIALDPQFMPSQSPVWPHIVAGNAAIAKATRSAA